MSKKLITCNANRPLAEQIAGFLDCQICKTRVDRFADQEVFVEIKENVRGEDVYVIQPTSYPANDHLMELLVTIDAARRGSARSITAVIPYYGYARQDRKSSPRSPISAKLVANLLTVAGANRVVTMDLHAPAIQGFFDIPCDNLYASPLFKTDIMQQGSLEKLMIVSPDIGGVVRARELASRLHCEIAIIDKRRQQANKSEVMNIIGDVSGMKCIIIDDIVDTAGTLCNAAEALMKEGAAEVSAYITHGVLSGPAIERVSNSVLKELVITDTIQANEAVSACRKIRQIETYAMFGKAIQAIDSGHSVSQLFKDEDI